MDNIAIENFAISAVKDSILMSEYLNPYISDNDKEPSWDGHIYIYDKKGKKKEDLIGRVPVQVKGTLKDDLSKDKISYPMEVADLRNYLRDGGVILFVVYINYSDESIHRKIYYFELTPINLRMLIPNDIKQVCRTKRISS
ncbi:MAG: DUF4365 domain-containing protein [Oscillospiraceae bacterium]|nr:DUF4365 domain-containing protein [Oscillospiraceae bacterium]